jgi:hypothetical protein
MKKSFAVLLSLLFLTIGTVTAQLELTHAPKTGAFIARNSKTNVAAYTIRGKVFNSSYTNFAIRVYESNRLIVKYQVPLKFKSGIALFNQGILLPAGKYLYKITYVISGPTVSTVVKQTDDIVVGDVFLIQGQSNALASSYSKFDTAFHDKFCRSYGNSSPSYTGSDTNWYRTNGISVYTKGSVGQWGAVMAKLLLDSFGVPICVINGAVGGTRITQHQVDPNNRENLTTIYGRLLYRVRKADFLKNVRGIIYYQGESDGSNAVLHDTLFKKLHGEWKADYPSFEKLYVVQVRGGCGGPSLQLRDVQRKFETSLPNCKSVSANGLNGHDGCHFRFENGYRQLGFQMAALLGRDFYGSKRKNIDPPHIKSSYYSNSLRTEITINMKNGDDSVYTDPLFHRLFSIQGDASVLITNGFLRNNKVVLVLSKSSCSITGLNYNGLARKQAWVKNSLGMGLITFYNVPIDRLAPDSSYSACKNAFVTLGKETISGCKYTWTPKFGGTTYNQAQISVKADKPKEYSLLIEYDKSVCKPNDTFQVKVVPDSIEVPELGLNQTICKGDSVTFNPNSKGFLRFLWSNKGIGKASFKFTANHAQHIHLEALSSQGCVYSDSVKVSERNASIELPQNIQICAGMDTLLSVPDSFLSYTWNGIKGIHDFRADTGLTSILVVDSTGCIASDSTIILPHESRPSEYTTVPVCKNSVAHVFKPKDISSWYLNNQELGDSIVLAENDLLSIRILDSNYCETYDTVQVHTLALPEFDFVSDTGFCAGSTVSLALPPATWSYYWNGVLQKDSFVLLNDTGSFILQSVDSNACSHTKSIQVDRFALPTLDEFMDSTLCVGDQWTIALNGLNRYSIDGVAFKDSFTIKESGEYRVLAYSKEDCRTSKTISIDYKECTTGVLRQGYNSLSVYPNPAVDVLLINSREILTKFALYSVDFKQVGNVTLTKTSRGHYSINLPNLSSGIYYLKLESNRGTVVKKVMIMQ